MLSITNTVYFLQSSSKTFSNVHRHVDNQVYVPQHVQQHAVHPPLRPRPAPVPVHVAVLLPAARLAVHSPSEVFSLFRTDMQVYNRFQMRNQH